MNHTVLELTLSPVLHGHAAHTPDTNVRTLRRTRVALDTTSKPDPSRATAIARMSFDSFFTFGKLQMTFSGTQPEPSPSTSPNIEAKNVHIGLRFERGPFVVNTRYNNRVSLFSLDWAAAAVYARPTRGL